jgi:hypothetical protein
MDIGTENAGIGRLRIRSSHLAGRRPGVGTETLPPGARFSKVLPQIVPGLPALAAGYFRAHADRPVFCFAVFGMQWL